MPTGVGGVEVAVAKRGARPGEQDRAVAQPRGEVAGETQRERQRPRGGGRSGRDVEALLDSKRAVRVPLGERSAA